MMARIVGGELNGVRDVKDIPVDKITGYTEAGRLREELWGQPIIAGYCGPMWDGDAIRYETPEVYDMLSR